MTSNERVKAAVLEVVDNQLQDKPSTTRQSYQRHPPSKPPKATFFIRDSQAEVKLC